MFVKSSHNVGNSRSFLSNSDVDAVELEVVIAVFFEVNFLVDNGVNGNSSLSSLPISDDKLSLSSSNRHKGIY